MTTITTVTDTLGVEVQVGDTIRVVHMGYGVRLCDATRLAVVEGITRQGNLVLAKNAGDWDPIARGQNVRPACVGVMRRDGTEGFEGNLDLYTDISRGI